MRGLLFIDDEPSVRRSIQRALSTEPFSVLAVESGERGIEIVKEKGYEIGIVIADFKMPGLDGLETLRRIGEINPETIRILLTGYATLESAIQAINEGMDGFLTKPFDNAELRFKIREILVKKRLGQLVSESMLHQMIARPEALYPQVYEATILFADIRGFTRISRNMEPDRIASLLNDYYFTPFEEVAHSLNGTTDKHLGDGMMVVFGVPARGEDDAQRAVAASVRMQEIAARTRITCNGSKSRPMHVGIGLATGQVVSGIFGSKRKKEFTSIGLPVIMASRLQELARPGEILICENTRARLNSSGNIRPLPPVLIRGLDRPKRIFRIEY